MVAQVIPTPEGYTFAPETRVIVNSGSPYVCDDCAALVPFGEYPEWHPRKGTKYTQVHLDHHNKQNNEGVPLDN